MILHVHKHPDARTLARCIEQPDDAPAPQAPWEAMTVEAFEQWRDAELAAGWAPPAPPPPELPWPNKVGSGQIRAGLIACGWVTVTNPANPDADLDAWALGLINQMPDANQRVIATVLWHNASEFYFDNPFIEFAAGAAQPPKTLEDRKTLFRTADTF